MVQEHDQLSEFWREAHDYPSHRAVAATLTWVCSHFVVEVSNTIDSAAVADDGTADPLNGDAFAMAQQDVDSAGQRSRSAKSAFELDQ